MSNASATTKVCEICGTTRDLDRHHVLHKGMGGSRDPVVHAEANLMTLCRDCHRKLHDGIWELQRSADRISVVDRHSGEQGMRRLLSPYHDATKAFQLLNIAEHSVEQMIHDLPLLSDDQLVEAFRYATSLGKRAWLVQAAIMYEAEQRSLKRRVASKAPAPALGNDPPPLARFRPRPEAAGRLRHPAIAPV